MHKQGWCVLLRLLSGQVISHIHYPLAEGKIAQIKPQSILSHFKWMSTQSRGVSHQVLPLNALQDAMEDFIDQYHVSLVHPTRQ